MRGIGEDIARMAACQPGWPRLAVAEDGVMSRIKESCPQGQPPKY